MTRLKLVDSPVFEEVAFGDTKFRVRVFSYGDHVELRRRCTAGGRLDEAKYEAEEWRFILVGWEGLCGSSGSEVAFDAARVAEVGMALPATVAGALKGAALRFQVQAEAVAGN